MGGWGDGEVGRWGDGEMGRWGGWGEYLEIEKGRELYAIYNQILGGLVYLINNSHQWIIKGLPIIK